MSSNSFNCSLLIELAKRIQLLVLDFDGVFTDNRVLVMQDGSEGVFCSRSDGLGLQMVKDAGIKLLVISKEINPVVTVRCRKLGIPCIQGCDKKGEVLKREAEKLKIDLRNTAYIGNDVNDLECLQIVGFPVCVADAYPEVKKVSSFITKANGGKGAIREFCDFIIKDRKKRIQKKVTL